MIQHFFFEAKHHPGWLPVFRCGMGILVLLTGIQLWPDFHLLYGSDSVIDHRLLQLGDDSPHKLAPRLTERRYLALYLVCCASLACGIVPRIAAIGLLLLHQGLYIAHPAFSYGFDYVACSALFYCMWFPLKNPASQWATPCLRVLQLHLCLIYFFGGFDKLIGPTWRNGEALWKALHLPDLPGPLQPALSSLHPDPMLFTLLGWGIILLEIGYPIGIWLRTTRRIWLLSIVALHAGIAAFLGLYHFSALMVLLNACAFYLPYRKTRSQSEQIANPIPQPAVAPSRRANPSAGSEPSVHKPNAPHV